MYYICYVLLYCIIFAFGAAIGSFLNVCIYRLPKEESLWRNNSHCMTCGTPIRKRDLIPIFSWCRLRGKNPLSLHASGKPECDLIRVDLCLFRHL